MVAQPLLMGREACQCLLPLTYCFSNGWNVTLFLGSGSSHTSSGIYLRACCWVDEVSFILVQVSLFGNTIFVPAKFFVEAILLTWLPILLLRYTHIHHPLQQSHPNIIDCHHRSHQIPMNRANKFQSRHVPCLLGFLAEGLRYIEYIFGDKTRMLTCNNMEFQCCSVVGYTCIRKTRKKLIWLSWLIVLMHLIKYIKGKLRWFKWQIKLKWLGISYVLRWIWLIFSLFILIWQ